MNLAQVKEAFALIRQDHEVLASTKPEHILTFTIEVTDTCNLRCVYCHQNAPEFEAKRDLSEETLNFLIDYACKNKVGQVDLTGGGDLLQHPSWRKLCVRLVDSGLKVGCTLNLSTQLGVEDLEVLSRFDTITASLDTMDREVLRRVRKAVDVRAIVYNMLAIKATARKHGRSGPEWGISVVLYPESAAGLSEVAAFAIAFGVKTLRIQELLEITSIEDNVRNFWTLRGREAVEAARAMQDGLRIARDGGLAVYVSTEVEAGLAQMIARDNKDEPIAARSLVNVVGTPSGITNERRAYVSSIPPGMTRSCSDPWSLVMVTGAGMARQCCFAPITLGKIGPGRTLDDIRNGPVARRVRERLLTGNLDSTCAACSMRALIPADRLRHTMSRVILHQQYPRVAQVMGYVDKARHYIVNLPHLLYLRRVKPFLNQIKSRLLLVARKLKHYFLDLPSLVLLRGCRKAKHYLIDIPHLIYLRKIKPKLG